ncbi:MAG: NAD-dependent epimerase/dehydratase family protein [Anaerolineae bacterium]|jgi:UDP-glucose 4-epimerase
MTRKALVTGAAGFIGSHLTERLLADGWQVTGVDCFTDYYARSLKEQNLTTFWAHPRFTFVETDLVTADLAPTVADVDVIFHQAGQAGVRASWGADFEIYTQNNVLATQRLLEAVQGSRLHCFVYASSSSIYGDAEDLPMTEDTLPRPVSPYGVTKLAAEHLCHLYHVNFGVPTISLRYFTVYGPRQRPDMAFHKFIRAMLRDEPLPLYGDGEQTRDFTFIADAVDANVLAVDGPPGRVFNIGGGSRVTINHVIATLEELVGKPAKIVRQGAQAGDVRHTWADTSAAEEALGFAPRIKLRDGLAAEVAWLQSRM